MFLVNCWCNKTNNNFEKSELKKYRLYVIRFECHFSNTLRKRIIDHCLKLRYIVQQTNKYVTVTIKSFLFAFCFNDPKSCILNSLSILLKVKPLRYLIEWCFLVFGRMFVKKEFWRKTNVNAITNFRWPFNKMIKTIVFLSHWVWDHIYITSAKRWVGGGGQILMFADMVGGWKKSNTDVS